MTPALSIIVPVYNIRAFLEKCINSILAQTFTDFELILVDDGSTDGSGEICDIFAKKDSRIKVLHKENGGVLSARKSGIQSARGEYIGYVDGDDWIAPAMYEKMVFCMRKYECDLVMCEVEHENKPLPLSSGSTSIAIEGGYYDRQRIQEKILPIMIYSGEFYKFGIYPVMWNKLYRRDKLIKRLMAVDGNIKTGEDAACVYPYLLDCESLYLIKGVSLYHYRRSQNQMTSSYDNMYFERFKSLYRFFSESDIAKSPYSPQLDYYFSFLTKTAVSNELRKENKAAFSKKLSHVKEISEFAAKAGFIYRINISELPHRLYFSLMRKNKPLFLAAGIYIIRFIQRIFG